MRLPMPFSRELGGGEGAVTVGRQSRGAALPIGHRRSRGPPTEHRQLREFRIEVDDARHSALLGFAAGLPRVVDIALDMLAGKGRQAEMGVALGVTAVPCA